jgi:hypothetical protein
MSVEKFTKPVIGFRATLAFPIIGLFLMFNLTACLNSRKLDKWVDKKYEDVLSAPPKKNTDYITVSSGLITDDKKNSTSKRTKSKLLPLVVYWQYDVAYTCTLNAKIAVNNFTNTAIAYAGQKGLKRKLNGRRIELTIDQLPSGFSVVDNGHMIWVIYAFGWDNISIQPVHTDMVVSYKIIQDNGETKNGVIIIPDPSKQKDLAMFNSTKRKTWAYLDDYNDNISAMSKKVVDNLMGQL